MLVFPGLFGAVIGSFLNVVAFRLPRGESLVAPGSRCPGCDAPIRPWHNVPIVGWLALRGRCRDCRARISPRYPLVEALTAALYVGVALRFGLDRDIWLPLILVTALVPIALIDLEHRVIPNRITGPAAVAGLVVAVLVDPAGLPDRLIAAAAAGGAFLLVALVSPRGMGMGDVKLVALLGLYLKASVVPALFVALVAGTVAGAAVMARSGVTVGRKTAIPFGPFLVVGGLVGLFLGPQLIDAYLHVI
jgi:leader peptidase (prepilin peptidase)/N-methyltransferase